MDKLKTLQTTHWTNIESQAESLFELISKYQKENKNNVTVKGVISKVNKVILEQNGFKIVEHPGYPTYSGYTYADCSDSYTISW
jgi:hypothetical protein